MNGFGGNHRSTEPRKKGRKVKTYHHDGACRCSAPFLKLHYNDCPVLTKPCPLHRHIFHRTCREDRVDREENVMSSKTGGLFRPAKSLLSVCDSDNKFNFRYCTPKNSSSHETVKQTDMENFGMNFSRSFVEKAKPFVAGQRNKIKKLKQCFHSPCNSIFQKSRSQTLVKQKSEQAGRDMYHMMPESPPDEKKYDFGFRWFPSGKLSFKCSDKKNDVISLTQDDTTDTVNNRIFESPYKSKKGVKEIPFFSFPKEATHFVYSSFTVRDNNKRKPGDKKIEDKKWTSPRETKVQKSPVRDTSVSEAQTTSSSDDSVYVAPFLFQPGPKKDSEESLTSPLTQPGNPKAQCCSMRCLLPFCHKCKYKYIPTDAPKKNPPKDATTQTVQPKPETVPVGETAGKVKKVSVSIQTDEVKLKDVGAQASDRLRELSFTTHMDRKTRDVMCQTEYPNPLANPCEVEEVPSIASYEPEPEPEPECEDGLESTAADSEPNEEPEHEPVDRNLSYVIGPIEPEGSDETMINAMKARVRRSRSDGDVYKITRSKTVLAEYCSKESLPYTSKGQESTHDRANQTRAAQEEQRSQQTSLQEELTNAVSDLTELKNLIHEYFKKAETFAERQCMVDTETMTDKLTIVATRPVTNAEAQTSREPKTLSLMAGSSVQEYKCIEIEDLEQAAVFCVCSVCGREIKRFNINIASNPENTGPLLEVIEKAKALDLCNEMPEIKSGTKVRNTEPEQLPQTSKPAQAPKALPQSQPPTMKSVHETLRLAAYESRSPSPTTSEVVKKACNQARQNMARQKDLPSVCKKHNGPTKESRRNSSPGNLPKDRHSSVGKECADKKNRAKSSDFYYPVIIKPFMFKHFTKMWEEKYNDNTSEESDVPTLKQKRTYDKYFEQTNTPAGKKIKQGFEEHSTFSKERPDFSDPLRKKKKDFGMAWPSQNGHFCGRTSPKPKDKRSKDPAHAKSLSLGSLNNLLTTNKSCHFRPIQIGCDEQSFRELFEFSTCKSIKFLKTNEEGILYHPWPNGILAYEADDSSDEEKKLISTPSPDNSPTDDECCEECICFPSDSNDSPDNLAVNEVTEDCDDRNWEQHSRKPEVQSYGIKSRPFSGCPHARKYAESGGTFWFGRDPKKK